MKRKEYKILEKSTDKKRVSAKEHLIPHGTSFSMAACTKCQWMYKDGKWIFEKELFKKKIDEKTTHKIVCNTCVKVHENNPDGVILIKGRFLLAHTEQIRHIVSLEGKSARLKNPYDRIIKMIKSEGEFIITTTDDKFTQRIARLIHRAFNADLSFEWLHEEKFVRITCRRDT